MKKLTSSILILFTGMTLVLGQTTDSTQELTLDEAVQIAYENNLSLKNAKKDVLLARKTKLESLSYGLPQVSSSASLNDNLKLRTSLIPGDFFGRPGELVELRFGTKYNTEFSVSANQLIFDGTWIVLMQTQKILEELSQQNLERMFIDTKQSVMQSYYVVLVSEESLRIIDGNLDNLKTTLQQTKKMTQVGMTEEINVDQLSVSVTMLENSRKSMERSIELNYNLLRFQLGIEADVPLKLTTGLDEIMASLRTEQMLSDEFELKNNIDFQLMKTQESLAQSKVTSSKAEYLPTLGAFYTWGTSGMADKIRDLGWFPYSMIGLSLNIPIFNSGTKYQKVGQAKIELEKAQTNTEMLRDQLELQEKQYKYDLKNALDQYESQKENVDVAKRVFDNTNHKYQQGVASIFELTQANDSYLQAESNALSAMMDVLKADMNLEKLLYNLK